MGTFLIPVPSSALRLPDALERFMPKLSPHLFRVGESVSGCRFPLGAEETPSTQQGHDTVRCKARALATEQKRNVHWLDDDDGC